jgi:hypothetical protein
MNVIGEKNWWEYTYTEIRDYYLAQLEEARENGWKDREEMMIDKLCNLTLE